MSVSKKSTAKSKQSPEVSRKLVGQINKLRAEEDTLLQSAKAKQLEATIVAFRIGQLIDDECGKYGENRKGRIAQACGFSKQTAYNYVHLARGAIKEDAIIIHGDLNREYWQALGSSVRFHEDLIGVLIRRNFLEFPLWEDSDDPDIRKPDVTLIKEIGKLVQATRNHLSRDLKIAHVFQGWSFQETDDDFVFEFPCKAEEEASVEQGIVEIARLFADISKMTGWPNRLGLDLSALGTSEDDIDDGIDIRKGDSPRSVNYKRERRRNIRKTIEGGDDEANTIAQDIHCGRCEEILKDRKLFPKGSIDVVICDPPYSKEYYKAWREQSGVNHDSESTIAKQVGLVSRVAKLLVEREIIKKQFMWFNFWPLDLVHELLPPLLRSFKQTKFMHQVLIWNKTVTPSVGGSRTFGRQAEAIIYINVGNKPLASIQDKRRKTRFLHSSVFSHLPAKNNLNGFWKPIPLIKDIITASTYPEHPERQVILDMFAGSGSTGVAAVEMGRSVRLIESHAGQHQLAMSNVIQAMNKAP